MNLKMRAQDYRRKDLCFVKFVNCLWNCYSFVRCSELFFSLYVENFIQISSASNPGRISLSFGYFSHFFFFWLFASKPKEKEINIRLVAYIFVLLCILKVRRHSRTFHYLWMESNIIRKEVSRISRISYASWYLSL